MTPLQKYLANGGLIHILNSYADGNSPSKVWIEKGHDDKYYIVEKESPGSISVGKPPANAVQVVKKIFRPCRNAVLTYLIETLQLSNLQAEEVIKQIGVEPPDIMKS